MGVFALSGRRAPGLLELRRAVRTAVSVTLGCSERDTEVLRVTSSKDGTDETNIDTDDLYDVQIPEGEEWILDALRALSTTTVTTTATTTPTYYAGFSSSTLESAAIA